MTPQEQRLATALRDLCGWQPGMVDDLRRVVVRVFDDGQVQLAGDGPTPILLWSENILPALDAPANWGVWLAWMASRMNVLELKCWREGDWEAGDLATYGVDEHPTPAHALLTLYCTVTPPECLQPSVLAWWEAEQGGESDG